MSLDDTRMSISSDDYNRSMNVSVSNTNIPINKGSSTKKCIFGIIIVGCLILSILIALDVISLKKIMGKDKENRVGLQVNKEKIKRENKENVQQEKKI